jgi:hypothetical protein
VVPALDRSVELRILLVGVRIHGQSSHARRDVRERMRLRLPQARVAEAAVGE